MKKTRPSLPNRARECFELLEQLYRNPLPVVCSTPEDVHRILALRSADLLEALTEPPTLLRTGERRIDRAIVTAITAQGRAACMLRSATATPTRRR
jgi:hypothetical protein